MTDSQYEPLDELSDWASGIGFRVLVYMAIMIFTLFLIFYGSALYEQGILTEGLNVIKFGLGTFGIVAGLMMLGDFARGLRYFAVHLTGRHRAYIAIGVVVAVAVAFKTTVSAPDYGELTVAYYRIVWAFSILVGLEFVRAGIYRSDVKRLRAVIGI